MNKASNKLMKIKKFIKDWVSNSKKRGKMYGSIAQIEAQWWLLDHLEYVLEDLPLSTNFWGDYISSKGFGAKSADRIIDEMKTRDPYGELNKLRNDYEKFRSKKFREMKKLGKKYS